jgi:hypothetical protein
MRVITGMILFLTELFLAVSPLYPQTMLADSLTAQNPLNDSFTVNTQISDDHTPKNQLADSFVIQTRLADSLATQTMLPDSIVKERIEVIQRMLNGGKRNANLWWYGWLTGYGAATVAQGAVAIASDKLATRQDMILGAFTTLLGMGGQIISPMVPGYAPGKLENIQGGTPEENARKLNEAEKLLEESAKREKDGRSWKIHALDGAVNLGCGFVVWFGFKRTYLDGLENFALNTAICEAQIFTQPMRAIKDYKNYCREYKTEQNFSLNEPKVTWSFTMVPGGLGMRLTF